MLFSLSTGGWWMADRTPFVRAFVGAVALAVSSLVAAADEQPSAAKGEEIVKSSCFLCHGENGDSVSELFPKLNAQHNQYVAAQLEAFKLGKRKSTQMADFVKDLTLTDMKSLGLYFASRPPVKDDKVDQDLAGIGKYLFTKGNTFSGVPACAVCHGADGAGTFDLPRLAGQHATYTERQLKAFRSRERDSAVMHPVAKVLTDLEIRGLAEYLHAR